MNLITTKLSLRNTFFLLTLSFSTFLFSQTFGLSPTGIGTPDNVSVPVGWTPVTTPDYSTTTINHFRCTLCTPAGDPWPNGPLPITPSGFNSFPVARSAIPEEGLRTDITGLEEDSVYTIEVSYMYPFDRLSSPVFDVPPDSAAFIELAGTRYFMRRHGSSTPVATTNVWYTETFSFTAQNDTVELYLGISTAFRNDAAVAFDVSGNTAISLPVDLVNFEGKFNENTNKVELYWTTAQEINNSHYLLQRSVNGREFETIDRIEGAGNSGAVLDYMATDSVITGHVSEYYYRIKQVDFDGSYAYSQVIVVELGSVIEDVVGFPNPFKDEIFIELKNSHLRYDHYEVWSLTNDVSFSLEGIIDSETTVIKTNDLSSGIYLVRLIGDSGVKQIKFFKQ